MIMKTKLVDWAARLMPVWKNGDKDFPGIIS